MVLMPNRRMPYAVAATAWGHLLGCKKVTTRPSTRSARSATATATRAPSRPPSALAARCAQPAARRPCWERTWGGRVGPAGSARPRSRRRALLLVAWAVAPALSQRPVVAEPVEFEAGPPPGAYAERPPRGARARTRCR